MANSWGAFNPNNLGGKTLDSLRNDIYAGFRTKSVPKYGWRGAGRDGRRRVQTGYSQEFNARYYKDHPGWGSIGDKLGININSQNDVRQLYDYVNGYKPPAKAAPTPAAAPVARQTQPLAPISSAKKSAAPAPVPVAAPAPPPPPPPEMSSQNTNISNGTLSIGSAESSAKKKNNLSKGTSQFKRNLKIMNIKA